MEKPAQHVIPIFFVFASLCIIFSFLAGYFWRNSYFILLASAAATWFIYKKYSMRLELDRRACIIAGFMLLFFIVPAVFPPHFPASSDALSTTLLRVITDKIPQTYEPYSGLSVTYPFGFLLFVKAVADMVPAADFLLVWAFVIMLGVLQIFVFHDLARNLLRNEKQALVSAILYSGARQLSYFVFWGLAPMLFAMDLFLLAFAAFIRKNKLYYLFLAASFLNHPVGFGLIIVSIGIYSVQNKRLKEFAKPLPLLLLLLPLASNIYLGTIGSGNSYLSYEPTPMILLSAGIWIGSVTILLSGACLVYCIRDKKFGATEKLIILNCVIYVGGYLAAYATGSRFFDLILIPVAFFASMLGSIFLSRFRITGRGYVLAAVFVVVIISLASSAQLRDIVRGTKISQDEVEFAYSFRDFDPALKKTLFISPGEGWMAHISNKIPYQKTNSNLVPPFGVPPDEVEKLVSEESMKKRIMDGCMECVDGIEADYIAVNRNYFPYNLSKNVVFTYKDFIVYSNA